MCSEIIDDRREGGGSIATLQNLDRDGIGSVPHGLVESRTRVPLNHMMAGVWLASYGLAIVRLDRNNVVGYPEM